MPLETKERQLICQMFYCKETNVSLSNKEMFDERAGDVGCQAASTCHSVDGWSSSVVRGDLLRNSKVGSVRVSNPEIMQLAGEKSPAATKKFTPEIDAALYEEFVAAAKQNVAPVSPALPSPARVYRFGTLFGLGLLRHPRRRCP